MRTISAATQGWRSHSTTGASVTVQKENLRDHVGHIPPLTPLSLRSKSSCPTSLSWELGGCSEGAPILDAVLQQL